MSKFKVRTSVNGEPTVTYFDDKGQILITGRRYTGYRAIVEWHLLIGLGHHMQTTHDYDMHRVTELMTVKTGGKMEVVTRSLSAGAAQNTPPTKKAKGTRKKIDITLIDDTADADDVDDTPEETVQEPDLGEDTKEEDASDVTMEQRTEMVITH